MSNCVSWKPLGMALMDYHRGNKAAFMVVKSSVEADQYVPANAFYREDLPFNAIEQRAIELCRGKVLDIGAGAGPHSLWLKKHGFDVTAIDIAEESVQVMKDRGLEKAFASDFYSFPPEKFDTLLFMMNGIGIGGSLDELRKLLRHAKAYLAEGGQILFDSTDIDYVTDDDRLKSSLFTPKPDYYGTVYYQLEYKDCVGELYTWLFVDPVRMAIIAQEEGYRFEMLQNEEEHYLGRLSLK